jgi:uncharacterized OsmC-like protein
LNQWFKGYSLRRHLVFLYHLIVVNLLTPTFLDMLCRAVALSNRITPWRTVIDIVDCIAEISAERVDAIPSVFSKIHMHFIVKGRGLKPSTVERAIKLSAEKYCSASIMLGKAEVEITHDFEVIEV